MTEISPIIGKWYRHENGQLFEVVAQDETDRTIEIQYFDGTIEELDGEAWAELQLEEAQAPEDWTGSVDVDVEEKDNLEDQPAEQWADPLKYLDSQE